ncbi:MAG: DNA repair protein RadC [Bacteroides sp.]|nr:DNA repair protein RadC [Ruminococcus flavefaciens]MCM1555240.1 DNA repair protein RadC [Bacteroides sp.]
MTPFEFILEKKHFLPIHKWELKDRPREKFLSGEAAGMKDEELLAILIGSGTESYSALDIARKMLRHFNGSLHELSSRSAKELARKFTGIGQAKAVGILAGIELGRRSLALSCGTETKVCTSAAAFRLLCGDFAASPYEKFYALLLAQSGRLLRKVLISEGGLAATVVDARKVFKFAIDEQASGLILAHNHPSGNLRPSPEDISITEKIKDGAKLLDLYLFDHIIVSGNRYFSFTDENLVIEPPKTTLRIYG